VDYFEPELEVGHQRLSLLSARGLAVFSRLAPYSIFDLVEFGNALEPFGGDGGSISVMHLLEFTPRVCPAIRQLNGARVATQLGQGVINCIAINLQRAAKARQNALACLPPRPSALQNTTPGGALPPKGRASRAIAQR
jgi:hypothetical protein